MDKPSASSVATRKHASPYFNCENLEAYDCYVAWLDVMGSRSMMTRSLNTAANFIFKLHVASLETPRKEVFLYPMNDGIFAVGSNLITIRDWIGGSYERINQANMSARGDQTKVFLARAGIAYGKVVEGRYLQADASRTLADPSNMRIRDSILIGAPVANAYLSEHSTSPFGVLVHESARTFAPENVQPWSYGRFMRYWPPKRKPPWVYEIEDTVVKYLAFCRKHSSELEYAVADIDRHLALAKEFFDY